MPFTRLSVVTCVLFSLVSIAQTQPTRSPFYARFYQALLNDSPSLEGYVLPEERALSKRFGIRYEGVKNKFAISFDFDSDVKRDLRNGVLVATTKVETLHTGTARMTLEIPTKGLKKDFYFTNGKLVSPVYYYARQWTRWESKHVQCWISDTTIFHREALRSLETFLRQAMSLLRFTDSEMKTLQQQKLIYVLCRDEEEIERLTGYRTRGIFLLPYDYIVTTYSCHFHELLHQLINFKLRTLPLYTHPFLQEGFAVAFGGRGGIAMQTVLQSGVYLNKSNFVDYREMFSASACVKEDASLTYPLSGLYVRFLFKEMGPERFLKLYRTYSGTSEARNGMILQPSEFPSEQRWQAFLDSVARHPLVRFDESKLLAAPFLSGDGVTISDASPFYLVEMSKAFGLVPQKLIGAYESAKFREALPNTEYRGERYLFTADSNEVVIYDLYTNNSVAGYSAGFSWPVQTVPCDQGVFRFWVQKSVFDSAFDNMQIVSYPRNKRAE